jgi:hypothetical protein
MMRRRTFILFLAVIAIFGCLLFGAISIYFSERRAVIALLSKHTDVEAATFGAFDDGFHEVVVSTRFSLPNRPETYLSLGDLDLHQNGKLRHLRIRQIGDLRFAIANETRSAWGNSVDIGPGTDLPLIIPKTIDNVNDLIDSYDELYKYFSQWPSRSRPGQVKTVGGDAKIYFVVKGDVERRLMHERSKWQWERGTDD